MNNYIDTNSLKKSLETGFIDANIHSDETLQPKLLTNDIKADKKILTTLKNELVECEEFWFSVAFITTSGIAVLFNILEELKEKGVKGKLLVSQYLNFTQPEALKRLIQFTNIESKIIVDGNFHAKGFMFKKKDCYNLIIGSSNLTANALCSNKEWNLKVTGKKDSGIVTSTLVEFKNEFIDAEIINNEFIEQYKEVYKVVKKNHQIIKHYNHNIKSNNIKPNKMQEEALKNIKKLRDNGKEKSLLISATGTGKTYLAAFDVKNFNAKRVLFVVHRRNIAEKALETFQSIFKNTKTLGIYSGNETNISVDFIFSTVQTISKDNHLNKFTKEHFDYIIVDETHRIGADSYQKVIDYFNPKFLLGMTATPERTDGYDIFKLFDYNIAYEIRLHHALREEMLCPFHYYGVSDISINEKKLKDNQAFNLLTTDERVNRIIESINKYGVDNDTIRGLIFCSSNKESHILSEKFNAKGYKTISLSGSNSEKERDEAIKMLESSDDDKIDYIFTVDIFNEGIDIPKVNQIIMLRPTQSAIVFVQQLGRGLRKAEDKEYLTVIDFIANYSNNYLVPIALYGDKSYNKDHLRKAISKNIIPGSSTINFDKISLERIYQSIDASNMQQKKDLVNDYKLLKYRIGYIPMMMDFIKNDFRDPFAYVNYSKSYLNFVIDMETEVKTDLENLTRELKLLEYISLEINNSKRIEETIILKLLIDNNYINFETIKETIKDLYNINSTNFSIASAIHNLNLSFITEKKDKKLISVNEKYEYKVVEYKSNSISIDKDLKSILENDLLKSFLLDSIDYAMHIYTNKNKESLYYNGFHLYQKYSRKDVFRILNWDQNPLAQNVGGYVISPNKENCPIFVNYHKEENISDTTKYEDEFINNHTFTWMSKSKRKLTSPDIKTIKENKLLHIPLFIKKSNDEGLEFYYMGDLTPIEESFEQTTMPTDNGKDVSVVRVNFTLSHLVDEDIYNYIIHDH